VESGHMLDIIRVLAFLGIYWRPSLCGTNCLVACYISSSTHCSQRSLSPTRDVLFTMLISFSVDTSWFSSSLHLNTPASRRYTFWMRYVGIHLVDISPRHHLHRRQEQSSLCIGHGGHNIYCLGYLYCLGNSLGAKHSSQVSKLQ
jgi:hypothetical protein